MEEKVAMEVEMLLLLLLMLLWRDPRVYLERVEQHVEEMREVPGAASRAERLVIWETCLTEDENGDCSKNECGLLMLPFAAAWEEST